jgi:hypothetical protein
MGFVNWTLKQCGYRYVQEAGARAIAANPSRWGATQVSLGQAEAGDIALWSYGHVNLVYENKNGKVNFVGGNQLDKSRKSTTGPKNNPDGGTVSISWPGGYNPSDGTLVSLWRPSKK